ncbi:two-component system response regulator [Leifsonia sp. ALI-44-B]|uniref:response regulator transcription factor n=1 Tax=Leifsonia sp. ALI-44-B TaxID=1933776 RepID=UPI00097C00CD|nr:response regulator transcription factor [Leifsonia sp. ALI-44-B]ONI61959.1 two-component system response regulator [Leifsonia sp. ALI-44-B]
MTQGERRVAVIIEDDPDIRHLLETVLTQAGFETVSTGNGLDGVQAVRAYDPIVTTLDVSLPGIDGFEAARRIRAFSSTYIVMLTAMNEEIDTLQGLEAGADDYLTKPFRPRELRARIEAMLRRPRAAGSPLGSADAVAVQPFGSEPSAPAAPGVITPVSAPPEQTTHTPAAPAPVNYSPAEPAASAPATFTPADPSASPASTAPAATPTGGVPAAPGANDGAAAPASAAHQQTEGWLTHNGLRLHPEMRIVEHDGKEVDLTRSEFDLIHALMESNRRVRSKADLALLLRGESYVTAYYINEADKRVVEVHMGNLRRKLGDSITSPRWIETVRGVGYRLAAIEA